MKSLVVLSALVSLAFAAPALPEDGMKDIDRTQNWNIQAQSSLPDVLKRERKSPAEITTNPLLHTGILNTDVQNVQHIDTGAATPMGRSFALKKPLIVKKKNGYRLYRDSEEEKAQADANETCGRQVKVKLCDEDGKFRNTMKGSTHEISDIHTTEDDVKHSIKMAKEAMENLQKDLKKIEEKSTMKMAHDMEPDTELHEDIEVARKALEHIHENFGNLESLSLHTTTTRDSEAMHDMHVTIAKTEEERMAQWKEAMENIQKNVEIARNIEDSFKAASHQESLLHFDQSPEPATTINDHKLAENIDSHAALTEVNHMRAAQNADLETQHVEKDVTEHTLLNQARNEHLSEHNARAAQNIEDDMKTAPSEMIETHIDNIKNQQSLRSENLEIRDDGKSAEGLEKSATLTENTNLDNQQTTVDNLNQEKSAEAHVDMLTGQSEHHITELPSMKADDSTETRLDVGKDTTFKTSENIPDAHMDAHVTLTSNMKPLSSDAFSEHQRNVHQKETNEKIEHHLKQEKSADDMTTNDDMIDFLAKSADHLDHDKIDEENLHKDNVMELGKAAEISKTVTEEHLTENWDMKPKHAIPSSVVETKHEKILENIPKSAEQSELTHFHNLPEQNENIMLAKSVDHASLLDHQKQHMIEHQHLSNVGTFPAMKAAEEHLHHLQHMHNAHWAHENGQLDHLASMKAAAEFKKDFEMTHGHGIVTEHTMDHLRNSHLAGESHIPSKMGVTHDFELSGHVEPHHRHLSRNHNSMKAFNHHEMSGMGSSMHPNFHPSMRDAMEGFGSDHMFRWKPTHESARGAYGSGLSSSIGSSGAVGLFPNANTGGCSIPLLLSCSPSVVSGSLAKAHSAAPSSYSAPSYRNEDDFGFHNKRDITKMNDIRTTNVMRTPTIVKQKSSSLLENKL